MLSVTCACLLAVSANCFSLLAISTLGFGTPYLFPFGFRPCLPFRFPCSFLFAGRRPSAPFLPLASCTPQLVTPPLASKHTQSVACAPCLFELGPGRPPAICQHIHHSPPRVPLCCSLFVLHPFVCFHLTHTQPTSSQRQASAHTHTRTRALPLRCTAPACPILHSTFSLTLTLHCALLVVGVPLRLPSQRVLQRLWHNITSLLYNQPTRGTQRWRQARPCS